MIHKDRDSTRGSPSARAQGTVPFANLLGTLARRVQPPTATPLPPPTVPPRVVTAATQFPGGNLRGQGVGLVAQSITATYQRTRSWRKTAHRLEIPLAALRAWAHDHVADLGILGSDALAELFRRKPRPRTPEGAPHEQPLILQQPTPPSLLPASTHWSGLRLSRDVVQAVADFCEKRGVDERVYFHDVFDAMALQETADTIGIGAGVFEELIRAAGGMWVSHTIFEALRVARGDQPLAEFLVMKFNPDRIDTVARELNVSTHVFMQLVQSFCPQLLQSTPA